MRLLATEEEVVEFRAGKRNETNRERNGDTSRRIHDSEEKKEQGKRDESGQSKKREKDTEEAERNKTSRGVALALSGG